MKVTIDKLGIIGYGSMGKLIAKLALEHLEPKNIFCCDPDFSESEPDLVEYSALEKCNLIIVATPAAALNSVVTELKKLQLLPNAIILSITAVMKHAEKEFLALKGQGLNLILSHPLFGPATLEQNAKKLENLKIALFNLECQDAIFSEVQNFFTAKNMIPVVTNSETHDHDLAYNHFVPYFLSHLLKNLDLPESNIRTRSAEKLAVFLDHTSFNIGVLEDIYHYNPYCKESFDSLSHCFHDLALKIGAERDE